MSNYLETVKCTKTVVVDPINNISAKINNAVTSASYTVNGMTQPMSSVQRLTLKQVCFI